MCAKQRHRLRGRETVRGGEERRARGPGEGGARQRRLVYANTRGRVHATHQRGEAQSAGRCGGGTAAATTGARRRRGRVADGHVGREHVKVRLAYHRGELRRDRCELRHNLLQPIVCGRGPVDAAIRGVTTASGVMKSEAHEGTNIVTQSTRGTRDAIRGGEPEGCCESSFYHRNITTRWEACDTCHKREQQNKHARNDI